jgi:hypothetical protein
MKEDKIGKYRCKSCKRNWYSSHAIQERYQMCIKCKKECYPQIIRYDSNNPPKCLQKVLNSRDTTHILKRAHLSLYCQNCLEGKYCLDANEIKRVHLSLYCQNCLEGKYCLDANEIKRVHSTIEEKTKRLNKKKKITNERKWRTERLTDEQYKQYMNDHRQLWLDQVK